MTGPTDALALASISSALGALTDSDVDVPDLLAHLVAACAEVTGSDAVAVLARDAGGDLALMAATSHRASELEMLQVQRDAGPCVDVLATGRLLRVVGDDALVERWPDVGPGIVEAGFSAVAAVPMRWHGRAIGGLNLFRATAPTGDQGEDGPAPWPTGAQAYADLSTLAVLHSTPLPDEQVGPRLHRAMAAREVVEQAKGVLAWIEGIDLEAAYAELLRRADGSPEGLTAIAREVIAEGTRRRRSDP